MSSLRAMSLAWAFLASFPALAADDPPPAPIATPAAPLAGQPLEQLSATRERPLFSPTRRPPPAPPSVAEGPPPPPPPAPPPDVALYGIVMDGEQARAVIRASPADKMTRVSIGDDVGGWKVAQIEGRKLVLSLDGRLATFVLFSGAAKGPARSESVLELPAMPSSEKNPQAQTQNPQAQTQRSSNQSPNRPHRERHPN